MKNSISINYLTLHRWTIALLMALLCFYLFIPEFSYAGNGSGSGGSGGLLPTGSALDVPGTSESDSWVKKFGFIIRLVIFIICIAALGLGIGDSIFSLFRTINDARQSGEWGPAMKNIGIVMAGIVFAIVLFGILNEFVFAAIEKFFT